MFLKRKTSLNNLDKLNEHKSFLKVLNTVDINELNN